MSFTPLSQHRVPASFICLFYTESEYGWDIYQDDSGSLHSISAQSPKGDSLFGNMNHVFRLMSNGHFNELATEAGLAAISGWVSTLPVDYFDNIALYKRLRGHNRHYCSLARKLPDYINRGVFNKAAA